VRSTKKRSLFVRQFVDVDVLVELHDVSGPDLRAEDLRRERNEPLVKVVPNVVLLDVRVHPWERGGHWNLQERRRTSLNQPGRTSRTERSGFATNQTRQLSAIAALRMSQTRWNSGWSRFTRKIPSCPWKITFSLSRPSFVRLVGTSLSARSNP